MTMQAVLQNSSLANPYIARRRRARELHERYDFARGVLQLYLELLSVQEQAWSAARSQILSREQLISYCAHQALPRILDVTLEHGPAALRTAVIDTFDRGDFAGAANRWLEGESMNTVERYLVRASMAPVLEALPSLAARLRKDPAGERHCPQCGGLPQLGYFARATEELVTPQRFLECERCAHSWAFTRMTCAACGETQSDRLTVFGEEGSLEVEAAGRIIRRYAQSGSGGNGNVAPIFRHVRIDGCQTCSRYLLTIDLTKDSQAVPVVDELAALPLDLWAKERGMRKVVPNLMGF